MPPDSNWKTPSVSPAAKSWKVFLSSKVRILAMSTGAPVRGAVVRIAARAVVRSNDVFTATAIEAGDRYLAAVPVIRGGLWDFDVEAVRGGERFVATHRLDLPERP